METVNLQQAESMNVVARMNKARALELAATPVKASKCGKCGLHRFCDCAPETEGYDVAVEISDSLLNTRVLRAMRDRRTLTVAEIEEINPFAFAQHGMIRVFVREEYIVTTAPGVYSITLQGIAVLDRAELPLGRSASRECVYCKGPTPCNHCEAA